MKINEFKVDEGFFDMVNAVNRHMGGSGELDSSRDARIRSGAMQRFIETFVTSTQDSINAAIQSGSVDPKAAPIQSTQPQRPNNQQNKGSTGPAKTSFGNFGKGANTNTRPPSSSASQSATKGAAKANAIRTYDARRGGPPQSGVTNTKYSLNEQMNALFEQLLEAYSGVDSISSYVVRAFEQYMEGVNLSQVETKIQQLANEVQQTYPRDKGKAALTKLAQLGWSENAAKRKPQAQQPQQPAQQPQQQAQQPSQQPQQQAQQPTQPPQMEEQDVVSFIQNLKQTSRKQYESLKALIATL